jgi:hypothetical protein
VRTPDRTLTDVDGHGLYRLNVDNVNIAIVTDDVSAVNI